jgi:hypothetical protein
MTEMNFGQRAGAERGRVRRNLLRHGSALAMGDRNEFRSTGRRGARQGAPQFIAAWVGAGDGDRNEFRSTGRRGARQGAPQFIAMGWRKQRDDRNEFGQRAGAERGRVRRNLLRHGSGLDDGATEMNFGQRAGAGRGRVRRNLLRRGLGEDMGRPK